MTTDECLCKKSDKLNKTLEEGYPFRSAEASGLVRGHSMKPARSQSKWYGLHTDKGKDSNAVSLCNELAQLKSSYSRTAKSSGLSSIPPASRQISHETLRKWEKLACESSYICNQTADSTDA